jgi:Homeodomain-like domain
LLKAGEGWTDQQICAAFDVSRNTSIRVRQVYLEGGLEPISFSSSNRFPAGGMSK